MQNRWSEANKILRLQLASSHFTLRGCTVPSEAKPTLDLCIATTLCVWCDVLQKWGLQRESEFDTAAVR
jgi:hypothetical protein